MNKFIKQNNNIFKIENDIISSIKDNKKYEIIKLKNNLEIILIEDKNLKQSSALMNVNVGSVHNYEDKPGIAHFIEHMLFLGSKKYPDSKYYQSFIESNGGYSNAYTSTENTVYYFSINSSKFNEALDIFAQFFIEPLFNKKYVKSEVENINSEHEKNKNQDMWRINELGKKFFDKNNPLSKFFTGNYKTLLNNGSNKDVDELFNCLIKFHFNYYCSNNMKLFIINNKNNKEFIDFLKKIFNSINKNNDIINIKNDKYLLKNKKNKILYGLYNPINNIEYLHINFLINLNIDISEKKLNENISFNIINKILLATYSNSLIDFLIKKNMCKDLSTDYNYNIKKNTSIYIVQLELTKNGSKNKNFILNIILSFFKFLNDNFSSLIDKFNILLEEILIKKKFNFKNNLETNLEKLENLSYTYNDFKVDLKYLNSMNVIYENNKILLKNLKIILEQFKLDNLYIIDISKNNKLENFNFDENYEFKYSIIEKNFELKYIDLDYSKFIPKKNKLIDNEILNIKSNILNKKHFIKLDNNKNIYLKSDNSYNKDLCYINFNLKYNDIIYPKKNIKYYLSLIIYLEYINYYFLDEFYQIKDSLNNMSINFTDDENVNIYIKSSKKYINYILKFLNKLLNGDSIKLDNEIYYNNIINSILDNLNNEKFLPGYKKIFNLINENLKFKCSFSTKELIKYTKILNKNLIVDNINKIKNNVSICGIIAGNCYFNNLEKDILNFVDNFNFKETKNKICFSLKKNIISKNLIKNDNNICINLLYLTDIIEIGVSKEWEKKTILNYLLEMIVNRIFYNDIRTEQKIGYIVKVKNYKINSYSKSYNFLSFIVQTTKLNKNNLKNKMLESIEKIYNYINKNFSDNDFINIKLGYLSKLDDLLDKNDIYNDLDHYLSLIKNVNENEKPIFNYLDLLKNILLGDNKNLKSKKKLINNGINKIDVINYFNKIYNQSNYVTAIIDK